MQFMMELLLKKVLMVQGGLLTGMRPPLSCGILPNASDLHEAMDRLSAFLPQNAKNMALNVSVEEKPRRFGVF